MKKPFDVKYRKEIESGKYQVVTEKGKPVNIIKWDIQGSFPICGITVVECCNYEGDETWEEERPIPYNIEGKPKGYIPSEMTRLFVITDEPEPKPDKEVLELCKEWFEEIMERCDRLTSGNVSHNGKAIHGFAKNCAEFIKEHINGIN